MSLRGYGHSQALNSSYVCGCADLLATSAHSQALNSSCVCGCADLVAEIGRTLRANHSTLYRVAAKLSVW
jgi:hypothetical protein